MVEFVSYSGKYPCLCMGTLVLKIDGETRELRNCMVSGGSVSFDNDWNPNISIGNWSVSDLPTDLKKYKKRDREMYQ